MTDPLYDRLVGRWTLRRRIFDNMSGRWLTGRGEAVWRPSEERGGTPGELDFMETLTLGQQVDAFRGYRYRFADGRVVIDQADGTPFIAIDLSEGYARAEHACGDDLYRGRVFFDGGGALWIGWDVRGPRKDYRSVSVFRQQTRRP